MSDLKALFERLAQEPPIPKGPKPQHRSNPDDDRMDQMMVHVSGGGEESLWIAVLLHAFSDARSRGPERWPARAFLLDESGRRASGRVFICDLLGLDPDWLRRKAQEFLDKVDAADEAWRGEGRRKGVRAIQKSPNRCRTKANAEELAA